MNSSYVSPKKKVILFFAFANLSLASFTCNSQNNSAVQSGQSTSNAQENKKMSDENNPINWPWRGTSFQSVKSDYQDIEVLKNANINMIRIQLKVPLRAKLEKISPALAFNKELEWAEKVLEEAKKNKITCIIAFNHLVLDPESKITEKSQEFWNDSKYFDSTYKYIEIIANRFKDKGDELSAYEIVSEPVITDNKEEALPGNLADFFKGALRSIRKYDSQRYFLLTPGPWGKPVNYKNWKGFEIQDNKIIYNAHMYMPDMYTHQGVHGRDQGVSYPGYINEIYWDKNQIKKAFSSLVQFQKNHKALVYIGEFSVARWSQNKDQWLKDVIEVMEENDFSWTYFTYESSFTGWDPYYEVNNPKENPSKWKIEYKGDQTGTWQLLKSYFQRNTFKMK